MFSFLVLVFAVSALYLLNGWNRSLLVEEPAQGGSVSEGVIGYPRFINPLLAFSQADKDLASLIYSGLMRKEPDGSLVPDLAESYSVSDDGMDYTFILKKGSRFQDGEPVTADDVIFTVNQAKNPVLRVQNGVNWSGITAEKTDDRTVKFTLSKPDASFLEDTTLGILPRKLWEGSPLELNNHNTDPVGSGPFKITNIVKNPDGVAVSYDLSPFDRFALGAPYIRKFTFRFYSSESDLLSALESGQVDQISGISPENAKMLAEDGYQIHSYFLPRVFGLFFNQSENPVFIDENVIAAINLAVDKNRIVSEALSGYGVAIDSPIPPSLEPEENAGGSDPSSRSDKIKQAQTLLDKSGWKKNADGFLEKNITIGKKKTLTPLSFAISTGNSEDLMKTASIIKDNLEGLGMQVTINTYNLGDLNQLVIKPRKYDSLLFGETVNRLSDLFAFWHSSQRKDPGLNVAMYTNAKSDKILEDALSSLDAKTRNEKYAQFEAEIKKDMPAVFVYSPDFIYVTKKNLKGPLGKSVDSPEDRFSGAYRWYTDTDGVWKIFASQNH